MPKTLKLAGTFLPELYQIQNEYLQGQVLFTRNAVAQFILPIDFRFSTDETRLARNC